MTGTLSRKGSGKVKHLETRQVWLQEHVALGNVVLLKVHRDLNLADALTHFWSKADCIKHFSKMSLQATSQRSSLAEEGCETSRQERLKNELSVCASLLGSAHSLAMTTHTVGRPRRASETELAKVTVRTTYLPTSLCSTLSKCNDECIEAEGKVKNVNIFC